jgi:xanthine dehydrogenase accessory factor
MIDLASHVSSFLDAPSALIRVVRFSGFGGRREGEAILQAADGRTVGTLLGGAASTALHTIDVSSLALVTVPVGDDEAVKSGLACGGSAELLVQPLAGIPKRAWELIDKREPFVLATIIGKTSGVASFVVSVDQVGNEALSETEGVSSEIVASSFHHLRNGKARTSLVNLEGTQVLFELISPQPHALIIGVAELAKAIERQGSLLGWTTEVVDERVDGGSLRGEERAGSLGTVDALIVLSHDLGASCAALFAALSGSCGYVGALGSRHTQGARREKLLAEFDIDEVTVNTIHGPIGLDLGSRTPEETALAIFAEILSVRGSRSGASLRSVTTPIH